MKWFVSYKTGLVLSLVLILLTSACTEQVRKVQRDKDDALNLPSDGVLVRFRVDQASTTEESRMVRQRVLQSAGLEEREPLEIVPGLVRTVISADRTLAQTLTAIRMNENVLYAEPNFVLQSQMLPNDPQFSQQWALSNISAPQAWDIDAATPVTVAVLDTGIDYMHEDLLGNIWVNDNEIPGNGIDDDANGYIDDYYGWDFVDNDNKPLDTSLSGHGTRIAGIIAAKGNNAQGIAGVNWKAKLMALRVLDQDGKGTISSVIKALQYAVAMGAPISNNSYIGGGYSQAMFDALEAARLNEHLFVAAAGNGAENLNEVEVFPPAYNNENILTVAASNSQDIMASFSNFGVHHVDIMAPGVDVVSTVPGNQYAPMDGTSAAAAFVSGAASLLWANQPALSVKDLKLALLTHGDLLKASASLVASGRRVNAFAGLQTNQNDTSKIQLSPSSATVLAGKTLQLSASGGAAPYSWSVDNTVNAIIDDSGLLTAITGGTTVEVFVTDSNMQTVSVVVSIEALIITDPVNTPDPLFISPANITVSRGDTVQFQASGGTAPYTWSIDNTANASMDAGTGLFTALNADVAVQVSLTDQAGNLIYATVTVKPDPVTVLPLKLTPAIANVAVGDLLQMQGEGGQAPYHWSVDNTDNATINAQTGLLKALKQNTQILVYLTDVNGQQQSATITITSMTLSLSPLELTYGASQKVTISGGYEPYYWSASDANVQIIQDTNDPKVVHITANTLSPFNLTVRDSAIDTAQAVSNNQVIFGPVNVLAPVVDVLSIEAPGSTLLRVEDSIFLSASGGLPPYQWSSTDSNVTVDSLSGKVTGVSPGEANIYVSDQLGTITGILLNVDWARLVLTPLQKELWVGEAPYNSVDLNISGGTGNYSLENLNTAIVNLSGNTVTAQRAGDAEIVLDDGNSQLSSFIKVRELSITTDKQTLITRESDIQVTVLDGVSPYSYTASGRVSVDSTGRVTAGNSTGSGTVTVTDAYNNRKQLSFDVRALTLSASATNVTRFDTVTLTVNGVPGYSWNGGGANLSSNSAATVTASFNSTGTFVISVTDSVGNSAQVSITVTMM